MVWFLYLVSLLAVLAGSALILNTEKVRDFLEELVTEANVRSWGVLPLLLGLVLAVGAFRTNVPWFLFILGLALGAGGLFFLLGAREQVESLVRIWVGVSDRGYRLWGIILLVMGVSLLAWF